MTDTKPANSSRRGRLFSAPRNISMATWLAVAVLVITITSLVVTSVLGLTYGERLANDLSDGQMSARASVKAEEISRYFAAMRRQTAAIGMTESTAEALSRFTQAFHELPRAGSQAASPEGDVLDSFYRDEFAPALEQATGISVGWRSLLPATDAGTYLQSHYIVGVDGGNAGLIDDAGDGSAWSEVHRELHLGLYETALRLGAEDLYLIEPANGVVVYSASKKPDFATSLDIGPHGGSTMAAAMRAVRDSPEQGAVVLVDMASYTPNLASPMMFMASPVMDGEQLLGIVVVKISGEPIDAIMTSEGNWLGEGFGETGEVFLTGPEGRMRSVARPFVEDSAAFLADLEATGTSSQSERTAMAGIGTTATLLKVSDTRELTAAVASEDLARETTDYLLRPSLSAVEQVDMGEFTWFAISQVATEEVSGPVSDFRRSLLIGVAVFVIGITFGTVSWARREFRPVRSISERLRLAQNDEPLTDPEGLEKAPTDFVELSDSIDEMLEALRTRQAELEKASQERMDTIRSLLPPAIAERVESGDRDVIDHIPQAGIVVTVTEGLGEIVRNWDREHSQVLFEELLGEVDGAAIHHGLERVKMVGDAYYAGCGLSQPYLDHVPRSVSFALDVRDIIDEFNARHGTPLRVGAGIEAGPVTVGLTGSMKLLYDTWGETVRVAHNLARRAQAGEILVSGEVNRLLPPDIAVAEQPVDGGGEPVFQVLGMQVPGGVTDE